MCIQAGSEEYALAWQGLKELAFQDILGQVLLHIRPQLKPGWLAVDSDARNADAKGMQA